MAHTSHSFGAETEACRDADLTRFTGYNMKRVLGLVQGDLAQVLAEFDLRVISFSVLTVVVQNPGINQTQLAETLKLERSNLVQIIDDLAKRALMSRSPIAGNRRSYALMPSGEGRLLWQRAHAAVIGHEGRILSMLSAQEKEALNRLLLKIRDEWAS